MIVGVHDFVDAVASFKDEVTSSEGGLWLVLMDGLLLIPFAMAAFFYPWAALAGLAVAAGVSLAAFLGTRLYRRRHLPLDRSDTP